MKTLLYFIVSSGLLLKTASATGILAPIDITTGTATQSTSHTAGPPERGIDGNLGNFTHTLANDPNPSWTVTLAQDETLNQIVVYNRGGGCCPERLADITVQIFDATLTEVYNSGVLNVANALGSPPSITLSLPAAVTGRSITVSRDPASPVAPGVLAIGELRIGMVTDTVLPAGSNLTQSAISNLSVSQSTTSSTIYPPTNAIDGDLGNFTNPDDDSEFPFLTKVVPIAGLLGIDLTDPENNGTIGTGIGTNFNWIDITASSSSPVYST
jgi:hypothetical protein